MVTRILGHGDELAELQRPFSGSAKMFQLCQRWQNPNFFLQKTWCSFFFSIVFDLLSFFFVFDSCCFLSFVNQIRQKYKNSKKSFFRFFFFELFSNQKSMFEWFWKYVRIAKSMFKLFSLFLNETSSFFVFFLCSDLKHLLSLFSSLPVRLPQSSLQPWQDLLQQAKSHVLERSVTIEN